MKIKSGQPFVILSSDNINVLASNLLNIGFNKFKYVKGCYNGNQEVSILVPLMYENPMQTTCDLIDLERLANEHKQECLLFVDSNRDAWLVYLGRKHPVDMGKFVRAPANDVTDHEAWTMDPKTGQYWICDRAA